MTLTIKDLRQALNEIPEELDNCAVVMGFDSSLCRGTAGELVITLTPLEPGYVDHRRGKFKVRLHVVERDVQIEREMDDRILLYRYQREAK